MTTIAVTTTAEFRSTVIAVTAGAAAITTQFQSRLGLMAVGPSTTTATDIATAIGTQDITFTGRNACGYRTTVDAAITVAPAAEIIAITTTTGEIVATVDSQPEGKQASC
jgi:hypothetical protein